MTPRRMPRIRYCFAVALIGLLIAATVAAQPLPETHPLATAIRERVGELREGRSPEPRGVRIVLQDAVARYYEIEHFKGAWTDPVQLGALISELESVSEDGLEPDDYHVIALRTFRDEFAANRNLRVAEQADLELIATDAAMLALYHLYAGKVDPVSISSQWNFQARPIHSESALELLSRTLANDGIAEAFARVRPEHVWYKEGRRRLADYREIAASGGWPTLPDGPVIKPGDSDPRLPVLRSRLLATGDLQTPVVGSGDEFDADTEAAVASFQDRHGLTVDGIVGPATRAALNVPIEDRIDQIRINLERARWVLHELHGDFVLVDVAGFGVSYFRNDQPIWRSRAVVGRPYRKTPIFKAEIDHVVFNPTWTIPPGILAKDKLPIIKRDPAYLARNNIRVIDRNGRRVDPYSVDWKKYTGRNIPYQLVQDPGPSNALGLVKIMFPNPYLVYLHDSPAKSLFERDQRAFSSGCIRVQKAFELTELVLGDPARWNQQTIDRVIAGKRTQTVRLRKKIPVLILYWTAEPRRDGRVGFREDIYERDAAVLAALNSNFGAGAAR